jgi:hypothetical protein
MKDMKMVYSIDLRVPYHAQYDITDKKKKESLYLSFFFLS